MKNPINQISLEGPDLSGKTTLYNLLHKRTKYRWNIQDRSCLSMLAFARLYGRNEFHHVERLRNELSNLNNFVIILLPSWDVIVERFKVRGDEIHDFISLRSVYKVFEEAASDLEQLPNVCVIRNEIDEFAINSLISRLVAFESSDYSLLAQNFMQACITEDSLEKVGVSLTSYDYGDFSDICKKSLDYKEEKDFTIS